MEIEHKRSRISPPLDDDAQDTRSSPLRRAVQVGLAVLNPFSDLMVIYRTSGKPVIEKLRILRDQLKRNRVVGEQLSWAQAVEKSGQPVEQLQKVFRRTRMMWWFAMTVTSALMFILLLMLAANTGLPWLTLLKAGVTDVLLASLAFFSGVKVLEANYRLWQLATQRVNPDERGTFQDYSAENSKWSQVLTFKVRL